MAYQKTTWKNGDVITAEKLNNMENGIIQRSLIIRPKEDSEDPTLDKTWGEINAAFSAGIPCYFYQEVADDTFVQKVLYPITMIGFGPADSDNWDSTLIYQVEMNSTTFFALSPNDYPSIVFPSQTGGGGEQGGGGIK